MSKISRAFLKALSSVTSNLSAAWFALAIITPNITGLSNSEALFVLTKDIFVGILLLAFATIIERILNDAN